MIEVMICIDDDIKVEGVKKPYLEADMLALILVGLNGIRVEERLS